MINIQDLNVVKGGKNILCDINILINMGEFVALTGKSGAGKTTLIKNLSLLEKPKSGSIKINGVDYTKVNVFKRNRFIKKDLGYIFQDFKLLEDQNVYQNLSFCIKNKSKKEKEQLILSQLSEVGLTCSLKQRVSSLSGGEKQRLAFVRVLLKESNIILADEPTGNLDDSNTEIIIELLHKMKQMGKTVIVVTHDHEVAMAADRVIEISK